MNPWRFSWIINAGIAPFFNFSGKYYIQLFIGQLQYILRRKGEYWFSPAIFAGPAQVIQFKRVQLYYFPTVAS